MSKSSAELHIPVKEPEFEPVMLVAPAKRAVVLNGHARLVLTSERVVLITFDDMPDDATFTMYVPLGRFHEAPKEGQRCVVTIQMEGQ